MFRIRSAGLLSTVIQSRWIIWRKNLTISSLKKIYWKKMEQKRIKTESSCPWSPLSWLVVYKIFAKGKNLSSPFKTWIGEWMVSPRNITYEVCEQDEFRSPTTPGLKSFEYSIQINKLEIINDMWWWWS
jgi:hypothetical protein